MRRIAPLLTLRQVERVTRRRTTTLRNDIRAGRLKATRIGRQVRISETDLLDFLTRSGQLRSQTMKEPK